MIPQAVPRDPVELPAAAAVNLDGNTWIGERVVKTTAATSIDPAPKREAPAKEGSDNKDVDQDAFHAHVRTSFAPVIFRSSAHFACSAET